MSPRLALGLVLAIGAALRFWHIGAGVPYRIGPDEPVITERAIHMMRSGEFHPRFFDYPGLYIYLQLMIGCATYVTGAMAGSWRGVTEFYPEHMFLWTRTANAALGTLTIPLVYRIGSRWGQWIGITAAGILAFWPNHVRESHFALTDVPLTFLITLAGLLSLRAFESGRLSWFVAAGSAVGLSAATKYNGAFALVMPLVAAAVIRQSMSYRLTAAAIAAIASGVAFLCAAPYTALDLPGFLNAFGKMASHFAPVPFTTGAEIYANHARVAVGWSGVLLAVAGLAWGTIRALRDNDLRRWAVVIVFPLMYFYTIATKELTYGRYLLPAVPFLCVCMAIGLVDLVKALWVLGRPLWVRSAAIAVLAGVTLFPLVRAGIAWPAQHGRRGTLDVAYEQILQVIPKGSGVAVERSALRLPDSLYKKVDVARLTIREPRDYIAKGTTYVIASSDAFGRIVDQPSAYAAEYAAYQTVFNNPGHCLPTIQPTASLQGPQIIICRLDAPIR